MLFASHSVSVFVPTESHISTNTLGGKKVLKHNRFIPFFIDKTATILSAIFLAYFLTSMGIQLTFDKYILEVGINECY